MISILELKVTESTLFNLLILSPRVLISSSVASLFINVTIVTSFSTKVAKLLTLSERTIAIATTIRVIVIQDIDAIESEKFLKTLLNESLIFLP